MGVILVGTMLAHGMAKIAISLSAGIRAVRVVDSQLIFTLLEVTLGQKSAVPQMTSLVPSALTPATVLLQPLPQHCAQAIHHHDTGEDRDKNRSHLVIGDQAKGSD